MCVVYRIATNPISMTQQGAIPEQSAMQTLDTFDSMMGARVELPSAPDVTRDAIYKSADVSLAQFFKRPITIGTYTWTPSQLTPFTAIFDPWTLYFGNKRVINRINNYQLLKSKLCVRFLINGNGFYYGRLIADWAPLADFDDLQSYETLTLGNCVAASQRMKVFIDPSGCCSTEMCLPFVWFKDGLSIPLSEWSQMGTMYIRELNSLKHANGATQPLTITVMAWAEDVEFAIPTSADSNTLVNQAGDEYSKPGPVQNIASAVASASNAVRDVPGIGPYARATSIAAGAVAKVAGMMGWSRPANIAQHNPMRPTFISALTPGDAIDNVSKLTVDSKQELTVDPNVIGVALPDEMSIAGIAARESWVASFNWATTQRSNDFLFGVRVTPAITRKNGNDYYIPACSFAVQPFDFWRGRMRYRFQIVASAHHKGRLRFVYDPAGVQSVESNVQYTQFVDIEKQRDFVMEIDWAQVQHYATNVTFDQGSASYSSTTVQTGSNAWDNGIIGIYVLNDLATPNSTINNDISVNMFVSCLDLEVASPRVFTSPTVYNTIEQAGEDVEEKDEMENMGCGSDPPHIEVGNLQVTDHDMEVHFGERIVNFRQLLHRYVLHSSFFFKNATAAGLYSSRFIFPNFPLPYGYGPYGMHLTNTGKKINYVNEPVLTYLARAFVAMRGSIRYKAVAHGSAVYSLEVSRVASGAFTVPAAPAAFDIVSQSNFSRTMITPNANRICGQEGKAMTVAKQQPVLEYEIPYQRPVRFSSPRVGDTLLASEYNPYSFKHSLDVISADTTNPFMIDRYVAVGEDFGLFWFQGSPPMKLLPKPGAQPT